MNPKKVYGSYTSRGISSSIGYLRVKLLYLRRQGSVQPRHRIGCFGVKGQVQITPNCKSSQGVLF